MFTLTSLMVSEDLANGPLVDRKWPKSFVKYFTRIIFPHTSNFTTQSQSENADAAVHSQHQHSRTHHAASYLITRTALVCVQQSILNISIPGPRLQRFLTDNTAEVHMRRGFSKIPVSNIHLSLVGIRDDKTKCFIQHERFDGWQRKILGKEKKV